MRITLVSSDGATSPALLAWYRKYQGQTLNVKKIKEGDHFNYLPTGEPGRELAEIDNLWAISPHECTVESTLMENPIFQIVVNRKIVSVANRPQDLDYSKVHGDARWDVLAVYEDESRVVASSTFEPADTWVVRLEGRRVDRLSCQSRIVPIIRGALEVWYWEGRLNDPDDSSEITVFPASGG